MTRGGRRNGQFTGKVEIQQAGRGQSKAQRQLLQLEKSKQTRIKRVKQPETKQSRQIYSFSQENKGLLRIIVGESLISTAWRDTPPPPPPTGPSPWNNQTPPPSHHEKTSWSQTESHPQSRPIKSHGADGSVPRSKTATPGLCCAAPNLRKTSRHLRLLLIQQFQNFCQIFPMFKVFIKTLSGVPRSICCDKEQSSKP